MPKTTTSEQLLIQYARNRTALKHLNMKIDYFTSMFPDVLDVMHQARKDYYDGGDEPYSRPYGWQGWEEIISDSETDDENVFAMGRLYDQRRQLNREAGQIRRNIATRGRKLISDRRKARYRKCKIRGLPFEFQEGEQCIECGKGTFEFPPVENCSCHLNPPCKQCVENVVTCNYCGWTDEDEDSAGTEFTNYKTAKENFILNNLNPLLDGEK